MIKRYEQGRNGMIPDSEGGWCDFNEVNNLITSLISAKTIEINIPKYEIESTIVDRMNDAYNSVNQLYLKTSHCSAALEEAEEQISKLKTILDFVVNENENLKIVIESIRGMTNEGS